MSACTFRINHPTNNDIADAQFDLKGTPGDLLKQLLDGGWLASQKDGDYGVVYSKENRVLSDKDSFEKQGVPDGAELTFRLKNIGAAPRLTGPLAGRLKLDFLSLKDVEGRGCFGAIHVYADKELTELVTSVDDAQAMRRYTAELRIPLPTSSRRRSSDWTVLVDLEQSWMGYPSASYTPDVKLLGSKPWHYRVSPSGQLCTKPVGDRGFVCGQHLGMIATLLNGDEPFDRRHDTGYDPAAYDYYRKTFRGPVNPDLEIPSVSTSLFGDDVPAGIVGMAAAATPRLVLAPAPGTPTRQAPSLVLSTR